MKVIICNKLTPEHPEYFRIGWRVPYVELEEFGWLSIDQSEIKENIVNYFTNKYNELPTTIFFWNVGTFIKNNLKEIINTKWTKCIYMDDIHQNSSKVRQFRQLMIDKFEFIFSTYAYTFVKFFPNTNMNKIIWFPHSVKNSFHVEFNDNPDPKILLTGCDDKNIYPFRHFIKSIKSKYPIEILKPLSYRSISHNFFGHEYIKYLNKFLVSIACCSNNETPYIVAKFFEIPASGALLLAYDEFVKKPLEELGFVDGVNYISVNFENADEKIKFVLNPENRPNIDQIRKNGYDLVWSKHTLKNRIKVVDDVTNIK